MQELTQALRDAEEEKKVLQQKLEEDQQNLQLLVMRLNEASMEIRRLQFINDELAPIMD